MASSSLALRGMGECMRETLVEMKVRYHELEERIQQAHNESNLYARIGELTGAREAETEMLRLIHEKDKLAKSIVDAANRLDDDWGTDDERSIPA